jgi:hypothetical protein
LWVVEEGKSVMGESTGWWFGRYKVVDGTVGLGDSTTANL